MSRPERIAEFRIALKEMADKVTGDDGTLAAFIGVLLFDNDSSMGVSLCAWPDPAHNPTGLSVHFLTAYLLSLGMGTALEALSVEERAILESLHETEDDETIDQLLSTLKEQKTWGSGQGGGMLH